MKLSVRASSLILPGATYFSISVGMVACEASAQTGHWRSRYSVTVIGALGSPSTPFFSGMPANIDAALVTEPAAGGLSEEVGDEEEGDRDGDRHGDGGDADGAEQQRGRRRRVARAAVGLLGRQPLGAALLAQLALGGGMRGHRVKLL